MREPIISSEVAKKLNDKVQKFIDPRLFLFCNYEPTTPFPISEEGQYLIAVQDLYKFSIDSSCVLFYYDKFLYNQADKNRFYRLREILDLISIFRTVLDHNQSDNDGWCEQNNNEIYQKWIAIKLGKDAPEVQEDYALLVQELKKLAGELLDLTDKYILQLSSSSEKKKIILDWIDKTINWYSRSTKTDIYLGQLIDAYIAAAATEGRAIPDWSRRGLIRQLSGWIDESHYYPLRQKKNILTADIKRIKDALDINNPNSDQIFHGLTGAQKEKAKEQLQEELEKMQEERKSIQFELFNGEQYKVSDLLANLGTQLKITMKKLEEESIPYTLLPQSLLQEDIDRVFGSIPIP